MSPLVGFLSADACYLSSKPADFGVVDLGDPHTTKPVDKVSLVLLDPQITVVQSESKTGDTPAGHSEEIPAGVQKEVAAEKTSSTDADVQSMDLPKSTEAVPDVDQSKLQEETKQTTEGAYFCIKEISESRKFLAELAKQTACHAQKLQEAEEGLRLSMDQKR